MSDTEREDVLCLCEQGCSLLEVVPHGTVKRKLFLMDTPHVVVEPEAKPHKVDIDVGNESCCGT
jgi:hypothetical protein